MSDKSIEQLIEEAAHKHALAEGDNGNAEISFREGALFVKDTLGMILREDVDRLIEIMIRIRNDDRNCSTFVFAVLNSAIAEFESKYPKENR